MKQKKGKWKRNTSSAPDRDRPSAGTRPGVIISLKEFKGFQERRTGVKRAARIGRHFVLRLIIFCMALTVAPGGCGMRSGREPHNSGAPVPEDTGRACSDTKETDSADVKEQAGSLPDTESGKDSAGGLQENPQSGDKGAADGKAAVKEICRVGDTLQDGDLKILYMASGKYAEKSEYKQPEPGHEYIFLRLGFQNTGTKYNCPVSLFSFTCYADGSAAQACYGGEKKLASSLSAGRSATGNLRFCVPEDAREIEIEYKTDKLPQGKVRFAYEGEKDAGIALPPDTRRSEGSFGVGDTSASDLQRIKYLSCEKDDSDNEFVRPEEGCSFWTLTFEFENLQGKSRQIGIHDFSCYADGKSCSRSLFRDDYLSADIPGGQKAKGTVTFEVPDEAQTVEAEYNTGRRADARVVFTVR